MKFQNLCLLKKNINIEIGQRVRKARENAHLSRDQLAEELNISSLFLGYIECGQKGMSLTTLKNLCLLLDISSDYILLGKEYNETSKSNIQLLLDSVDSKYIPLLESILRNQIGCIKEIEDLQH